MHSTKFLLTQLQVIILVTFFTNFNNLIAQVDTLYSWDFEMNGNSEGWQPTHSLAPFVVHNGILKSVITGPDPYMNGPRGLRIAASRYANIMIRIRVTHDSNAEFFWTTTNEQDFIAGLEFGFKLIPDGEFHVYEVAVGNSDKWQGTITRLRLDPGDGSARAVAEGAIVEIDYIRVVHLGPRLELVSFAANRKVIAPGDTVGLALQVKNTGDETVTNARVNLELAPGLNLIKGTPNCNLPDLMANAIDTIQWQVAATDTGAFNAIVKVLKDNQEILTGNCMVKVIEALPAFPSNVPLSVQAWSPYDGHWLLENSRLRLAFVKTASGFGPIIIFTVLDHQWQQIGVIQPPGELAYQSNAGQICQLDIFPQTIQATEIGDSASVELRGYYFDVDNVQWQFSYHFDLSGTGSTQANILYHAAVSSERQLMHFAGPMVRIGEGSSGAHKQEALFPGLEWLIDAEASSAALDVHPPNDKRYLPHPYKVTTPVLSVTGDRWVVGLSWHPLLPWSGNIAYPSPVFASPNSWDGQANHLLGLVVPAVGQGRAENAAIAATPFLLNSNSPVNLQAVIFVQAETEQLAGLKWWLDQYGIPALPEKPRSYQDDIVLNCESFMEVLWEPDAQGWHMAFHDPWGPMSDHTLANQVWLGSLYTGAVEKAGTWRGQMQQLANKLLVEDNNPAALGWDFAFRFGELDRVWAPLKSWVAGHSAGQIADGGWLYSGDPTLKNRGETSLGTCALRTHILLQAAIITGDDVCRQRGLAGLEFMEQFRVPRGAQTWEVPLHAPDILAAAQAILAYTDGFLLTDQVHYLNEAVRWAYAGLPFVYLWAAADRPIMAYGSIPVFGASWYTGAWFGNIVQWNGLDYAYALLKLWQFDQTLTWKQIAEGLTICGMQMQRTRATAYPENRGMYPDAYSAVNGDETYHWDLAPGKIMQNVLALTGNDPDVHSKILTGPAGKIHVNSGIPFSANWDGTMLTIHPVPVYPDSAFFLIANVLKPEKVLFASTVLPFVKDVDLVSQGWSYPPDGNIIIKVFVMDSSNDLQVQPVSLLRRQEQPQWNFDNEGYNDGWYPNFAIENLDIVNGYLAAKSIGNDPWLTGPAIEINAIDYDTFKVKMRIQKGSHAQLFWLTKDEPYFNEKNSYPFAISADGMDHIYALPLCDHHSWIGEIQQLRFDPTNQGNAEFSIDYIHLVQSTGSLVQNRAKPQPTRFELLQNFPNPFQTTTQFSYWLPQPADVRLCVYDVLGRKIVEFNHLRQQNSSGTFLWNRQDANGKPVPAGIYFYQLTAQLENHQRIQTRKLVLLPFQE